MDTKIYKISDYQSDRSIIRQAGDIIRQGGLVAFPTETVYGLGADALQKQAARKIYKAKGRPSDNPLIIHICEMQALEQITVHVPDQARQLADSFWPGPLTMILDKADCVPEETTGGLATAAIRMPSHPLALALIEASGGYIAAPSANTSGRPSPTRAEHVAEDLAGKIDLILDGGEVGIGLESTIIDLSGSIPTVLRPGAVTYEMLTAAIGQVNMDQALIEPDSDVKPKAPGMKYRHYAPKAQLIVVEGSKEAVIQRINALAGKYRQEEVGIICTSETVEKYSHGIIKSVGSRLEQEEIARNLYRVLREFDQMEVACIYSETFAEDGIGQAIMNRLLKAAGYQIITA